MPKPIIHLAAPANPATPLLKSLNIDSTAELVKRAQQAVGRHYRVRASASLVEAKIDERKGGRSDDRARVRELQSVLENDNVVALVALKGGGWLTRILGDLDFRALARRRVRLAVFGFSEITPLVNLIGLSRRGFGYYYMTPGYPVTALERYARLNIRKVAGKALIGKAVGAFARKWALGQAGEQFDKYFAEVVSLLEGAGPRRELQGKLVSGRLPAESKVTMVGGCLSLVTPLTTATYTKRIRITGKWIALEDLGETPHRIDRQFAHIKLAGWFEKCAGVLIGDFHLGDHDQIAETLAILKHHLPRHRSVPVVHTKLVGHTWPQAVLPLGRPVILRCTKTHQKSRKVEIRWAHMRWGISGKQKAL